MQIIQSSYRALGLLVELNWDRVFMILALVGALFLAAYLGAPLASPQ